MGWLDEGPDGWTLRYLAGKPLWLGVLAAVAMLLMQRWPKSVRGNLPETVRQRRLSRPMRDHLHG